jgi:hypothetical protein
LHASRFEPRQIEEGRRQRIQSHGFVVDVVDDLVALFLRHFGAQQQIGGCAERGKRRA